MSNATLLAPLPRRGRLPWHLAVGGAIVAFVLAVAVLSLFWTPGDPYTVIVPDRFQGPSPAHWLGTDRFGHDVASMLMVGARNSISVALIAVLIGMGIGVPLGLAAAASGGWRDLALSRLNDLVFAFPALLLAIMIASSRAGKANTRSFSRLRARSRQPPLAAAARPRGTPMPMPIRTAISATEMEFRAPTISIDATSWPKRSVPSQCAGEGPWNRSGTMTVYGSPGVQNSDRTATARTNATMAPPTARCHGSRPRRGSGARRVALLIVGRASGAGRPARRRRPRRRRPARPRRPAAARRFPRRSDHAG